MSESIPVAVSVDRRGGERGHARLWPWYALAGAVVVAAFMPMWLSLYALGVLITGYYYGVFAMSWDLLFGYAGEVNFGPTFLIGLSAYTTGMLVNAAVPVWLSVVLGTFTGAIGGLLIALPALKLRGAYFGLITLVAVLLLKHCIVIFSDFTGGELGLIVDDVLVSGAAANYWLALGCLVVCGLVIYGYAHSAPGLILQAMGQDPVAAQTLGFNIVKHKFFAFFISAVFSGLAGSLLILYMGIASMDTAVDLAIVVQIIMAAVLGGRRTIVGGALGAIVIIVAAEYLRPLGELNTFVVSLVAIIFIIFTPDGIAGMLRSKRRSA